MTGAPPGLAGALAFASVAAMCTTFMLANTTQIGRESTPDSAGRTTIVPENSRFWGREAFVPDWRRGDEIDAVASEYFIKHYWPKLRPPRYANSNASQPRPAADGVRIFPAKYWHAIDPDHQVSAEDRFTSPIELFAARGESEPVAIGVRTGASSRVVSLTTTTLASAASAIDAQAVTNRLMLSYSARRDPGRRPTETVEKPMVLLKPPANRWKFPPATAMAYVVDFHVPVDQPAGEYRGEIIVSVDGEEHERLPVLLTVLPFSLKTNGFHAGAFGTTYNIWTGGFSGYTEEMIEMDSRYGYNLAGGFFNKGNEVPFVREKGGRVRVDESDAKFAKFNATMKLLRNYGMGDVAFWNWGASGNVKQFNNVLAKVGFPPIDTDSGKRGFALICAALKRAEIRNDWPEFVLNPYDEALKDQDSTLEIIKSIPAVRQISPSTRLYMTEWRRGYTRLYQSTGLSLSGSKRPRKREMRILASAHETPRMNFQVIGANTLSHEAANLQHRLGGEYWHYGGASRLDAQSRLAYGFIPWVVRADASLIWANYKGDLLGNGWTLHYAMPIDPDGRRNRDTRGPIIPSVRAIAVREGIDDRKYIETLRFYATQSGSMADLRYLDSLSTEVRRSVSNIIAVGGLDNIEPLVSEQRQMDELRAELRTRIVKLMEIPRKSYESPTAVH
tara:strand:+ start:5111 stop:7132 length:2022 start_codon:yes stop_codon:yes gene_type:complete